MRVEYSVLVLGLVLFSSSCARMQDAHLPVSEISAAMGFAACERANGFSCIELRIRNDGSQVEAFGLTRSQAALVAHPLTALFEGESPDGHWVPIVTEVGSYMAAREFLSIGPGVEARLLVQTGGDLRASTGYRNYRVRLSAKDGRTYVSDVLDLGPRVPATH